jgi:amino acid transporter
MTTLSRHFTPINALLLSINGIIGSAWLFAPLYAAKIAGAGAIIAWLIGGSATVLIAFTFAELSTLLPIAGGTTRFPQLSHGAITSFIISWISWLSCVTMPPIEVQATLQYASTYFPWLTHIVAGTPQLTPLGLVFATLLMLILCAINVTSFKGLIRFNFFIFSLKISIIVLTIFMLISNSFHSSNFVGMGLSNNIQSWQAILTAVASGGIAFAFTGFKHGVELAGETTKPALAIPLAIIGSVIGCLLLYLGLQIAFIGALQPESLRAGWHALSYVGDAGPFVGIALLLGLGWLAKLLYVDAVLSPLGAGLIYVTSTSRIIYAMSKNGYLAPHFSRLNQQHLPVWAIGLNFIVGMFLFLPLPGWQAMVSFLVSAVVISYAMGPIALICLRLQLPDEKRSFRLPAATPLCILGFYCCNLISYWTGWETISKLAVAIAIGVVLLLFAYWRGNLAKEQLGCKALFWLIPYLLGLLSISYLGSFGGKNIITFGWDFLVIAVFSLTIMLLAVLSRLRSTTTAQFNFYKESEVQDVMSSTIRKA